MEGGSKQARKKATIYLVYIVTTEDEGEASYHIIDYISMFMFIEQTRIKYTETLKGRVLC